jgi:hypothetical protein
MRACIIQHVISASLFEEKTVACFDQYADKTPSAGILVRRRLKGAVQRITHTGMRTKALPPMETSRQHVGKT